MIENAKSILLAVVRLAIELGLGREAAQSILDAEYAAADALADAAEEKKLSGQ